MQEAEWHMKDPREPRHEPPGPDELYAILDRVARGQSTLDDARILATELLQGFLYEAGRHDINLLKYAARQLMDRHDACYEWLKQHPGDAGYHPSWRNMPGF